MDILISAYAVSPNHGSELGVGWNWIIEIAKYCKVYVITEAEFKTEIEKSLFYLPQKNNIIFYFNDIGEKARIMCWNQGDYRFYHYYRMWQKETLLIAKEIIDKNNIDIIHQLNMIGYREPGYLWKIKGIPFVWGPIGGFNFVKTAYLPSLGLKKAIFYALKNSLNYFQAHTNRRVRKASNHADMLLAASGNTKKALNLFFNKKSLLVNETGCHIVDKQEDRVSSNEVFKILWVGRFIPTKMLGIALETIAKVRHLKNIEFHIVGDGLNNSIEEWKYFSQRHEIEHICVWHGKVPRKKVDYLMNSADLLFFTSIVEGTSHVIMEAIANKLPILCFDTGGHGEIVSNEIGRKIPLTYPKDSINKFAVEIDFLYANRALLNKMSEACSMKIYDLSWEFKGKKMFELYSQLLIKK